MDRESKGKRKCLQMGMFPVLYVSHIVANIILIIIVKKGSNIKSSFPWLNN